ncbi:MAG: HigA family addiction module antidote protein [Gammaproteobacteria bacterium]|nr:HigA family addiction module antidote protein [Gammaproteobacteria bacterium]MYB38798.1 HigA family addiction module antidote protein [Gammaproteobacteria bacterium]
MPMLNPPHPGEHVRACLDEMGWSVAEAGRQLGVARNTLSRLLHGRHGISADMALAMERVGWSNAEQWMRVQAAYDLAQAKLRAAAVS